MDSLHNSVDTNRGHVHPAIRMQWQLDRLQRLIEECLDAAEKHRAEGSNVLADHYDARAEELEIDEARLLAILPLERVCPRRRLPSQERAKE